MQCKTNNRICIQICFNIYHFKIDLSYFFQNSYRTISPRLKYLRINKFNSDPKNKLIFAPIQNVGRRGIGGKQGHRTWPAVNIVSNRRIKHSSGVRWKNRLPFPRVGRGGTITAGSFSISASRFTDTLPISGLQEHVLVVFRWVRRERIVLVLGRLFCTQPCP